jgi:predicted transcriptional regulator
MYFATSIEQTPPQGNIESNRLQSKLGEVRRLAFPLLHLFSFSSLVSSSEILAQERPPSLIHLKPEDSIFKAGKTLLKFQIHRLPVIDREEQNTILYIITHTRIIKFLMGNVRRLSFPPSLPSLPSSLYLHLPNTNTLL